MFFLTETLDRALVCSKSGGQRQGVDINRRWVGKCEACLGNVTYCLFFFELGAKNLGGALGCSKVAGQHSCMDINRHGH